MTFYALKNKNKNTMIWKSHKTLIFEYLKISILRRGKR